MGTGDLRGSLAAMMVANSALRGMITYDVAKSVEEFEATAAIWTCDVIAGLSSAGDATLRPIFVIGLPRSGSKLIENILGRHPEVAVHGEDQTAHAAASKVARPRGRRSVRWQAMAARREARTCVVDRMLANFRHAGALAAAFPKAQFVHPIRDPRATALSILQN